MDIFACEETIDNYLLKCGLEEKPKTDKERIKRLKNVIYFEKVNLDHNELKRSKNMLTADEYLKLVEESSRNIYQARDYINLLNEANKELKEEDKEARKEEFRQKVKKIFKK